MAQLRRRGMGEALLEPIDLYCDEELGFDKPVWDAPKPVLCTRETEEDCAICIEAAVTCVMGCGHYVHEACIREWCRRSPTCPLCRVVIV